MKQENETFNCLKMTMAGDAETAVLKKAYVSPTTVFSRVIMEMDVLAGANSAVCTEGYVSGGYSVSADNPFSGADSFAAEADITAGW